MTCYHSVYIRFTHTLLHNIIFQRPAFMESCAFDYTLYTFAQQKCTEILDKLSKDVIVKKQCHGHGGRTNCIEQCANNLDKFYKECHAMGVAKTQENKQRSM